MSKRAKGRSGVQRAKKERKKDGMRLKGRAARFKVGPRAPSSRAARDDHARVSTSAPSRPFEPRTASSSPTRSFSTLGMSIWALKDWHVNRDELRDNQRDESFDSILYGPKTDEKRGSYGQNCAKNGPTLSQILLSVVDKTAYLGGNVCAKILSDPLQLGPRAKTLKQEGSLQLQRRNFPDRQELLRSSRNLNQKMTPWHKEHSNGLCSTSFPTIPRSSKSDIGSYVYHACVKTGRRNKAVLKIPEFSHRRCHACAQSLPDSQQVDPQARARWKEDTFMHDVELSDRQDFTGSSRNPDRKTVLKRTKNTPVASVRGNHISQPKLGFPQAQEPCKSRQRKLSDGTKNVEILTSGARSNTRANWDKICKEKWAGRLKRIFPSRTAAFARRVFPDSQQVEPGCVGKITTPATTWQLSVRR
uniref:Uncharacterized protein n=1 Tax=Fagus sylvatica TaxID=28930 RepID=A0A2N9F6M9_FAGSY